MFQFFLGLLALYILHLILRFIQNIRVSKKTSLPYLCLPFSEFNIALLALFSTEIVPFIVNNKLPTWLADVLNDNVINYRWTVKERQRRNLGPVYMVASPTTISCNVSDAAVVSHICNERRAFPKPVWQYRLLELYGPNILTCEDKEWAHHRRHTASTFNEKNNELVWHVAIKQTLEMTDHWSESHNHSHAFTLTSPKHDMLKFTLNVICAAGFGVALPFKPTSRATLADNLEAIFRDTDTPPVGFTSTFRSVMEYMNSNLNTVILANLVMPRWIPRKLMPFFKRDFHAYDDFGKYLKTLIDSAKINGPQGAGTHNLLQGISKAQAQTEREKDKLSDTEILGNVHIFTVAGHETTATTLRFVLVLLALHPDIQDWLYQCIREATQDQPSNPTEWDYATVFPRLTAPLCIMLETLRLYPPVVTVPKWTGDSPMTIAHQDQKYLLPPKTNINLNANALHYSQEYWGPDAASFDPRRWDRENKKSFLAQNDGKSGLSGPGLEYSNIHKPVRGAYMPFSDGFRSCVGKRFAQVEFVAALTIIFGRYRVSLAKVTEDEDKEKMIRRAERVLQESATVLTLVMQDDVPLLLQQRAMK